MKHLKRLVKGVILVLVVSLGLLAFGGLLAGIMWVGNNAPKWATVGTVVLAFTYFLGAADEL